MEHSWSRRAKDIILALLALGVPGLIWLTFFANTPYNARICTKYNANGEQEVYRGAKCKNKNLAASENFLY